MTLFEKVNEGIKEAIRARDQLRLDTLRMLKSKVIAVDARGGLPDAEVLKLFKTYSGNLQEALEQAISAGREQIAEKLKLELAIVHEFLPKPLSRAETEQIVHQAMAESGAKTKKEFGVLMKSIMKINSSVDGKIVKEIADHLLT